MNAVVESNEQPVLHEQPITGPLTEETVLLQVIARAAQDQTVDLDRMERLLVMHERLNARKAAQQYVEAMARFKAKAPTIMKDKLVSFPHKNDEGDTSYRHATLGAVCEAIIVGLGEVGISHRWDLKQENARITVTCVLTHTGGHSERTTLDGAPDASGKKNTIQQVASTVTYLERYTLLAATGMATKDQDDDARAAGLPPREDAPEGYDDWKADMTAKADEGSEALTLAWKESKPPLRRYVVKWDEQWWTDTKAKAAKSQAPA